MRTRLRQLTTLLVLAALATAVVCVVPLWWARVRPVPATPVDAARVSAARAALQAVRVTEPLPLEGYQREFFGQPWADVDGNGCDTRNDVLAAWLTDIAADPTRPCLIASGTLRDPYTGHLVDFVRGPETSAEVQIDHVVALADAWRKGAADWPADLALAFANDPANLVPTEAAVNQDKSAADAAGWLPPNQGFHCAYAVQQVLVKSSYGIGVTSEEVAALSNALARCPPQPAAAGLSALGVNVTSDTRAHPVSTTTRGRSGRVRTRRRHRHLGHRPHRRAHLRVRAAAPRGRGP
ncbi:HNH endonuclease family protein [Pseudactinotalea terrae]|uniref:HNH endonuclease family protein n=1 Tax=Pseudactinotalea terrae TaxID=1743262 RepID=UPI0012E22698|nr:HNH endonuclease family protein [Pseudactinotalea terrae]